LKGINKMPALLEPKNEYLIRSGYAGGIARETAEEIQENDSRVAESLYLFPFSSCFEMLVNIAENCSKQDWDGYGAVPIPNEVYLKVLTLISNFPMGIPAPELVPENDGAITFEWHVNPKQELSLSVNPNNLGYYVFTDGSQKIKGSYVLQESLPPFFINMINQVIYK